MLTSGMDFIVLNLEFGLVGQILPFQCFDEKRQAGGRSTDTSLCLSIDGTDSGRSRWRDTASGAGNCKDDACYCWPVNVDVCQAA